MKKLLSLLAFLFIFSTAAFSQTVINGNQVFVPNAGIGTQIPNEAVTGTVAHKLAKLTGSGTAIMSGTTDTSGVEGVVAFGAGRTGNASIIKVGQTTCVFDGATTANDYVINSTSIAGDCSDGGAVLPDVQVLGRVLSGNVAAGTYEILVSVGSGGGGGGGTPGGTTSQVQYNSGTGFGGATGVTTDGHSLHICGPVPWRDVTCFGAFSSTQSFTATTVSGSPIITLNTPGDWINSTASLPSYISIEGAGPLATVLAPDITPVAIIAIARNDGVYGGSVEQITVAGGITNGPFFFTASQFVNITGVTNTAFNAALSSNFNCNTSDSTHICVWPATVADGTSSSGGFINPAMAFYEGIHPGSTTHAYRVASIDDNGGVSAKSAPLTITNDPATLDEQNTNWITWGYKIPVTSGHINGYCLYKDTAFLKDMYEPGFMDDGNTQWSRPDVCPATEPATATHQTLTCEVLAGAGTTTLTLVQLDGITPCNASVSTSGLFTFHDAVPAVNAAMVAAKADNAATQGGGPEVIVPSGLYWYSRLNVDDYTLDMWGAPKLTGYPMTINNAGTINGHGQTTFNGGNYNQDRLNIPASNEGDAFLIQGFTGTIRGFQSEVRCGHDFVVPVGSNVVIENFNAIHQACGDCGLIGGNSFFFHINNFNCTAAHIAAGASYNRAGIYFSNRTNATNGPWVEIHFNGLFCSFGCIHIDSPAPSVINANFQNSDIYNLEMEGDVNPANDTKGVIVIHAGCQVSPHAIRANVVGLFVYHPTISDPVLPLIYDDDYLDPACRNLWGTLSNNVVMGGNAGAFSFGGDGIQGIGTNSTIIGAGTGDTGLPSGGTLIGGGDGGNILGGPSFCNFLNLTGTDVAGCGYLLPPPFLVAEGRGVGGSCAANTTRYFQLQGGDPGGGWTRVYTEGVATTGGANELPGIVYGATLGAGFISPKYRAWVGNTSGGENRYFETTDPSQFTYDCNDGVTIYHGAAVFASPAPTKGNAYFWKVPSQSGSLGSNPGWYGFAPTDLFGFGKVPAYTVDSSGIINTDKGLVLTETAAPAGISSADIFWGSSSLHWPEFIPNAGSALRVAGISGVIVSGHCVQFNDTTGTLIDNGSACGSGGTGTVTSFSAGTLSPLFTTSVATAGTTPALTFTLSNAAADTVFGNCTGGSAAPSYCSLIEGQLPAATVFTDQNATFGAHTYDFSGATVFKVKTTAGYAPTIDGQCGVNTTTHLFVCGFNSASTITIPVTIAAVSHDFLTSYTQTTGAFTQAQPTLADIAAGAAPAGLFDFSTGTFKLPVAAGFATTANGNIGYDTTNKNWHVWDNGADKLAAVWNGVPTTGNCAKASVVSSVVTLTDAACSGATLQTDTVNNSSQVLLNFTDTSGASGISFTNPSGGIESATLANVAGGGNSTLQGTLTGFSQGDFLCGDATPHIVNCVAGVTPNPQTGTTYTVVGGDGGASDRGKYLTFNNTSAVAVTLPQAGTTGFASNLFFAVRNINGGPVTITPATSTINGGATLVLFGGQQATIVSDNTNYFATISGMPWQVGSTKATAQTTTISATTVFATGGSDALYRASLDVDCTSTAAAETLAPAIKFTDTSNTVQTITGSSAVCTTLGSASISNQTITFQAKASTNIQYLVTASASTATWNVRVSVEQLSLN